MEALHSRARSFSHPKDFGQLSDSDIGTMAEDETELHHINETGHVQELDRNFSLLSVCSVGIVTGNTWAALGGTITIAISNGGPPGVIYEFIVVSLFYWLIAASLAELASSMPSSSGVYQWASITAGPRYGRVCGFFAGWWNFFAWNFASASMSSIIANIAVAMYSIFHPSYQFQKWHVFIAYILGTWACCSVVLFANRALPMVNNLGLFFILAGVLITIVVCATMPSTAGSGHATSAFVWTEWSNSTGWTSDGLVFLLGMLNGAFAVGTPDCCSHLAEEIPNPKRNVPLAIAAQMVIGFFTALCYMIAIFYSISSLDDVLNSQVSQVFPLAQIYYQATSSQAGAFGLLLIILLPVLCTCIGTYITAGRTFWTLARDDATPFSSTFARISLKHRNPLNSTILCGCITTLLGCINVGSPTAFNAFVSSFVVLSTLSYLAAILPFMLTGRFSSSKMDTQSGAGNGMIPGPFEMSVTVGYAVNFISCLYIVVFVVIYCFPTVMPLTADNMNWTCATVGGISVIVAVWWFRTGGRHGRYVGPQAMIRDGDANDGAVQLVGQAEGRD